MQNESSAQAPLKAAYLDAAVAYGGSLHVLAMLFGAIDRAAVEPALIAYVPPEQLEKKFDDGDVGLLLKPTLSYAARERWLSYFDGKNRLSFKLAAYLFSVAAFFSGLPNQLRLFRYFWRERPDILHVNNSFAPIVIANLFRTPIVWHLHGTPSPPNLLERLLLASVTQFIAISDFVAEQAVASGYPQEKMVTCHNPAPQHNAPPANMRQKLQATYGIPQEHNLIAHIGRLVRWKGQMEFLQAFALTSKRFRNVTALIIGDDAENFGSDYIAELKNFADKSQLGSRIIFTGQISNVTDVMAAVDIIVHSSIEPEPFGLVITEAMSMGTAVIAADLGAPREIIHTHETGLLVPPESREQLSSAMLKLLENEPLRKKIAINGLKLAHSKFSLPNYALKIISIYRSTLAQQP